MNLQAIRPGTSKQRDAATRILGSCNSPLIIRVPFLLLTGFNKALMRGCQIAFCAIRSTNSNEPQYEKGERVLLGNQHE